MKCLHLCNDLLGSKVHQNLYKSLAAAGFEQEIFYPARNGTTAKFDKFCRENDFNILASAPTKKYHRIFFRAKIRHLWKSLKNLKNPAEFQIVHATTLFTDGALALKIFKEYQIPYILAVRGTDINLFMKYRKDLYWLFKEIIENAAEIIFISESLRANFFKHPWTEKVSPAIRTKCRVIPNGLDPYWLDNIRAKNSLLPTNFLYIGKLNSNKNVLRLIRGLQEVREEIPDLQLAIVGGGGDQEAEVKRLSHINSWITYHGPIYDKKELKHIYRSNHVFAMASIGETFGLVYIEALTQGLPIIYTANQGIDGTFSTKVGEAVEAKSIENIKSGISRIIQNYDTIKLDNINFHRFSWPKIAEIYLELYEKTISKQPV